MEWHEEQSLALGAAHIVHGEVAIVAVIFRVLVERNFRSANAKTNAGLVWVDMLCNICFGIEMQKWR